MVRYWFSIAPLVIVGTLVFLALPWLAVFALAILAAVALGGLLALAWAVISAPRALAHALNRWRQSDDGTSRMTADALSPASSNVRPATTGAAVILANSVPKGDG